MVFATALGDKFKLFAIFNKDWSLIIKVILNSFLFTWLIGSCHYRYATRLSSVCQPYFCTPELMATAPLTKHSYNTKTFPKLTLTRQPAKRKLFQVASSWSWLRVGQPFAKMSWKQHMATLRKVKYTFSEFIHNFWFATQFHVFHRFDVFNKHIYIM